MTRSSPDPLNTKTPVEARVLAVPLPGFEADIARTGFRLTARKSSVSASSRNRYRRAGNRSFPVVTVAQLWRTVSLSSPRSVSSRACLGTANPSAGGTLFPLIRAIRVSHPREGDARAE